MSDLRKAAQMALEALEYYVEQTRPIHCTSDAIDALRAALAQPERKPLTDDEIAEICMDCSLMTPSDIYFARAIERAHGIE